MEKFTFFWRGPFSQWYRVPFSDKGCSGSFNLTFSCAEQYMMYRKAMMFGDRETANKIMATKSPKKHKSLGRKVALFDETTWNTEARRIVYWGNLLKFSRNPDLKKILLATVGTTLVEASPYDKVWGIGLKEGDPKTLDRATWQGKNWLGECLTEVRDDLIYKNHLDEIFAKMS